MGYNLISERTCHVARIRRLQESFESHRVRSARRTPAARSGVQKTGCAQSEQARTKAETKAEITHDCTAPIHDRATRHRCTGIRVPEVPFSLRCSARLAIQSTSELSRLRRTMGEDRTPWRSRSQGHSDARIYTGIEQTEGGSERIYIALGDYAAGRFFFPRPCRLTGFRFRLLPASDQGLAYTTGKTLHGKADAVEHKPCGLLRDAQVSRNFVATDSVLAISDRPNSGKPLIKRNRGILKNALGLYRKLFPAFRALPDAAGLEKHWFFRTAMLAGDTLRPAAIRHFVKRVIGIGVMLDGFQEGVGFGAFHE